MLIQHNITQCSICGCVEFKKETYVQLSLDKKEVEEVIRYVCSFCGTELNNQIELKGAEKRQ